MGTKPVNFSTKPVCWVKNVVQLGLTFWVAAPGAGWVVVSCTLYCPLIYLSVVVVGVGVGV